MRLKLYLQIYLLRAAHAIIAWIDRFLVLPRPVGPTFTVHIPAKTSKRYGSISLYFYLPKGYTRCNLAISKNKDLPLIFNVHGGGFIIGSPTDDARWATALLAEVDAVFVSVGYRIGPEYPQPTAVDDCVDALHHLWDNAGDYGFDPEHTIATGFSAGGQLCLTVALRYYRQLKAKDYAGKLSGIVAFYPSVDHSIPRQQKIGSNPISKMKGQEPPWMHRMIDEAYYCNLPAEGLAHINFSPAKASEEELRNGLPTRIALFTCEFDKLLVEGEEFRRKLQALGKVLGGRMIMGMKHGFDKQPGKHVEARDHMYSEAIKQIRTMV